MTYRLWLTAETEGIEPPRNQRSRGRAARRQAALLLFAEVLHLLFRNLLGSSIYNILFILSITCIVSPGVLPVERQLLWFDIPLMAGVAIGAIPVFVTGKRVSRLEGGLGIAIYLTYLLWLCFLRS